MSKSLGAPMCPECEQGKHPNCAEQALYEATDEIGPCVCSEYGHTTCAHCGNPLVDRGCVDGLNHCSACKGSCARCNDWRAW